MHLQSAVVILMFKMIFKALLLLSVLAISAHQTVAASDKIICFFSSWAVYRTGDGAFKPQNIDPKLCTHVLYAFLGVESTGALKILDPWSEEDLHGLDNVKALKSINPNLKVLISIGGWNAGNDLLNGVAASSTLRANLIRSCIAFFQKWGYDGIDIDWVYPYANDKNNFVKLLQEMKTAFAAKGYILSVTAAGSYLETYGYDIPQISANADLINLITYDYHLFNGVTGLNSPLYGDLSVDASVRTWLDGGAEASKLSLSVPFYGHSYSLASEANHDVGDLASVGISGPYTQTPGTLGYNEICEFYNDWTTGWDDDAQVPYKYEDINWVSYENEKSVGLKAKYAKDNGLAGVAIWSIDTDDFHGACGTVDGLLKAIAKTLAV